MAGTSGDADVDPQDGVAGAAGAATAEDAAGANGAAAVAGPGALSTEGGAGPPETAAHTGPTTGEALPRQEVAGQPADMTLYQALQQGIVSREDFHLMDFNEWQHWRKETNSRPCLLYTSPSPRDS